MTEKQRELYENLIETSNEHHNAIYDYLEENGMDNQVKMLLESKVKWVQMIMTRYGISIDELIELNKSVDLVGKSYNEGF